MSRISILEVPISSLVISGLAHMSGFEVLSHGTDPLSYWSILRNGADPSYGGSAASSCSTEYQVNSEGRFHVFFDKGRYTDKPYLEYPLMSLWDTIGPTVFKALSAYYKLQNCVARVCAAALSIFTPTLRFMYRTTEMAEIFELDPDFSQAAMITNEVLPHHRIGLLGLFYHIRPKDVANQLIQDPLMFLAGSIQLTAGVAITGIGLGWLV